MEANKFGFGPNIPPAFKFDPTDAEIVAYYLLPRALNLPNPYARAIIEEDPGSAPPWEILQRHGDLHHAFFFGPPKDPSYNGGRKNRTIEGGVWKGQSAVEYTVTLLHPGGGEVNIRLKRYDLAFSLAKVGRSTGYVMHEYEILSPPLPGTVLTRLRAPKNAPKNAKKKQVPLPDSPDPEQPGPSHQYDAVAMIGNGEGFAAAQDGALYGGGDMVKNTGYDPAPLHYDLPLVEYNNNYCAPIQDQPGTSYNYDAAAMGAQGFAGAQFYGGGMVDTSGVCYDPSGYVHECGGGMVDTLGAYYDPSGYVPDCGGDHSNYYGEYQQWRYQQDQSNQYQAEDAALMSEYQQEQSNQYQAGETALMSAGGEQQAGAPCGYSDNDSVMGTEASTHSTISLCGPEVQYQQWQYQLDQSKQYQAGDDAVICADSEGFSGKEQAGALCGNSDKGGVVGTEASPHSAISLCIDREVECDEYQQWQYQEDPCNQYQARNDAVVGAGGKEQACALYGNSDNGSVVGTDTCAHSTISVCGDEEVVCDDATFYKLFFGHDDDLKCEQNGAGDPANEFVI